MIEKVETVRDSDKQDARDFAKFLADTKLETNSGFLLGVAVAAYINGFNDAERAFKAAQVAI